MRAWIYDRLFYGLSKDWYRRVVEQLPEEARVLDVGVGTGSSMLSQRELIQSKGIKWLGIDINASYLRACQSSIDELGVSDSIQAREQSVYDLDEEERFDAVYFSASFMLLPDQREALRTVMRSLDEGGVVCFTQTFETKRAPVMEIIKPMLRKLTTVDFGVVTYQDDFIELLSSCDLEVIHNEVMSVQGPREMRIIIASRSAGDVS